MAPIGYCLLVSYQPGSRGPFPVGVCTESLSPPLAFELWYPAVDAVAGRDLDEEHCDRFRVLPAFKPVVQKAVRDAPARVGQFPLVLFSHGLGGHRRQSTFLTTHLASRGFVVASVDHPGSTTIDLMSVAISGTPLESKAFAQQAYARPRELQALADACLQAVAHPVLRNLHRERIAAVGHSFGGYTSLALASIDERISACVPMAPPGGADSTGADVLRAHLRFDWPRVVPTLFLAAEEDSIVTLDSVRDLARRMKSPCQFLTLPAGDHLHFSDQPARGHEMFRTIPLGWLRLMRPMRPFAELCSEADAQLWIRQRVTAHLEAFLAEERAASDYLRGLAAE